MNLMAATSSQSLVILGSTRSIGTQSLEVVATHPDRFTATGLAAGGSDIPTLAGQILALQPSAVAVAAPDAVEPLKEAVIAQAAAANQDGRALRSEERRVGKESRPRDARDRGGTRIGA